MEQVSLPQGIVAVEWGAFSGCSSLKKIDLPNSLKTIGNNAFMGCSSLQDIIIPNGVVKIENGAFCECANLQKASIPDSINELSAGVFYGCTKLSELNLPNNLTIIDEYALCGCKSLSELIIPPNVKEIGTAAICISHNEYQKINLYFMGNAPVINESAFAYANVNAFYPSGNTTWTKDKLQNYSGKVTWKARNVDNIVTLTYRAGKNPTHQFYYDDNFFLQDNETYNNSLAVMSLGLAMTAFSSPDTDDKYTQTLSENERAKNIIDAYNKLGFSNIACFNYNTPLNDKSDKVAFSFATKQITEDDAVIAVILRGGGYGAEWSSNFNVGTAGNSAGFDTAAKEVLEQLKSYMRMYTFMYNQNVRWENAKFWIVGYSRSAAVANILAHYINEDVKDDNVLGEAQSGIFILPHKTTKKTDIYAYTFATPSGYLVDTKSKSNDSNIMNIVSANDLVPNVPLSQWGFSRYGKTYTITDENNTVVKNSFYNLTGESLTCYNSKKEIENLKRQISEAIPNRAAYAKDIQPVITSALGDLYAKNGKNSVLDITNALSSALKKRTNKTMLSLSSVILDFGTLLMVDKDSKTSHLDFAKGHYAEHYLSWLESGGVKETGSLTYANYSQQERDFINQNVWEKCYYSDVAGVITNPVFPISINAKDITRSASNKPQTFFIGATTISNTLLKYKSNNSNVKIDANGRITVAKNYVGKAEITITADRTDAYKNATKKITVTVNKLKQPMTVSPTSKTYKVAKVKKKAQQFTIKASKAQGKVTYKSNKTKYVTVTSKGKVTVKKKTPKGKYTITVTAAGKGIYAKGSKTVTITVK